MKPLTGTMILLLMLTLACERSGATRERFFLAAVRNRPGLEIQDLYKLLYQGRFGIGHLIPSREAARRYLLDEIATLPQGEDEPLLEPCSPDGRMVRVNLRPFVRRGLDPEKLLGAMLKSLLAAPPDTAAFQRDWEAAGALLRAGRLPLDAAAFAAFTREVSQARYPALHHSASYSARYHPAYRVVVRDIFLHLCPEAGQNSTNR